jgi:hypothetical protein
MPHATPLPPRLAVYCYGEYKLWWEPIKARMPDVSGYLPVWLGGRGGVFAGGSNAYKFVGAAGGAGAAAPSATPISASAYGST